MISDEPNPDVVSPEELETLESRARNLGVPRESTDIGESIEVLRFTLAQEHYAVEIEHVEEVHPFRDLAPIPCTPNYLVGAVSWRGRVLGVVDVKKFFGLPERGLVTLNRIVVLKNDTMEFGLMADEILGVSRLPLADLKAAVATLTGIRRDYLRGIGPDSLVVLDGAALLSDERLIVNEDVQSA